MNKITLALLLTLSSMGVYSQSTTVDAKSITAAKYANQAAIDAAITSPEEGMQVYNIALKSYMVYDGTSWKVLGGSLGWSLTGNAGTDATSNFIGTTDARSLRFSVNNIPAGEISATTDNTSFGVNALRFNTTGSLNTANGVRALFSNTLGFYNTANGVDALRSNVTGYGNTANGVYALGSNTTGFSNTANGVDALGSNTTGWNNTANGYYALRFNTTGFFNTANGVYALGSNTTGNSNTANGMNALLSNSTGWDNTANGVRALSSNITGSFNTANGVAALGYNTIGSHNTANGNIALHSNTSGTSNTANGYSAGSNNNTGNQNVFLGAYSNSSTSDLNNSIAIGFGAIVNASNKVRIGNESITVIEGQVPFTNPSDRRLKENIIANNNLGLEFVSRLQPVSYNYLADATQVRHDGFIAQDVEQVLKDLGVEFSGLKKDTEGMYSLAYSSFVMPLVNAVKELKVENEKQRNEIDDLKKKNETLEALLLRVTALEESRVQNTIGGSDK